MVTKCVLLCQMTTLSMWYHIKENGLQKCLNSIRRDREGGKTRKEKKKASRRERVSGSDASFIISNCPFLIAFDVNRKRSLLSRLEE